MRKTSFMMMVIVIFIWGMGLYGQSLELSKLTFNPGEKIILNFYAPANLPENAWIGIIPSHVAHGNEAENDKYDLTYQYLKNRTSGYMEFIAPSEPGNYDFRMHDTDNNGKEIASISFTVGISGEGKLTLERSSFARGETILVHFRASSDFAENAWVGIIPSNVAHGSEAENDRYDIAYQYLKKATSGTLTFTAPNQPGSYDFRMFNTDSNGLEVTSITFYVGD